MKTSRRKHFFSIPREEEWLNEMSLNGQQLLKKSFWWKYVFEYSDNVFYEYHIDYLVNLFGADNHVLINELQEKGWSRIPVAKTRYGYDILKKQRETDSYISASNISTDSDEYFRYRRILRLQVVNTIPFALLVIVAALRLYILFSLGQFFPYLVTNGIFVFWSILLMFFSINIGFRLASIGFYYRPLSGCETNV